MCGLNPALTLGDDEQDDDNDGQSETPVRGGVPADSAGSMLSHGAAVAVLAHGDAPSVRACLGLNCSVGARQSTSRGIPRSMLGGMVQRKPFPLLAERPAVLEGIILDFQWDLERLHGLPLPVREVPVSALRWHLGLPLWAADGRPFRVSPAEVAAEPSAHPEQWGRTMAADLRYPLDAYAGPEDGLTILDGVHRLLKAVIEGHSALRVRVLEVGDFDAIAVPAQR